MWAALGCSECYNVFEEEILPLLAQIQPDSHHHGKTPARAEKRETETQTISDLEQQLSLAVAREDYERRPSCAIKSNNCVRRPINLHAL